MWPKMLYSIYEETFLVKFEKVILNMNDCFRNLDPGFDTPEYAICRRAATISWLIHSFLIDSIVRIINSIVRIVNIIFRKSDLISVFKCEYFLFGFVRAH